MGLWGSVFRIEIADYSLEGQRGTEQAADSPHNSDLSQERLKPRADFPVLSE